MPTKNDTQVYPPFPWKVLNGPDQECHVIVREQKGQSTVHIQSHLNGDTISAGVYFHPDELDIIIAALQAAKAQLGQNQ